MPCQTHNCNIRSGPLLSEPLDLTPQPSPMPQLKEIICSDIFFKLWNSQMLQGVKCELLGRCGTGDALFCIKLETSVIHVDVPYHNQEICYFSNHCHLKCCSTAHKIYPHRMVPQQWNVVELHIGTGCQCCQTTVSNFQHFLILLSSAWINKSLSIHAQVCCRCVLTIFVYNKGCTMVPNK